MKHSKYSIVVVIANILNDIIKIKAKNASQGHAHNVVWWVDMHEKPQGTGNNYDLITFNSYRTKITFQRKVLEAENKIIQVSTICLFQHMGIIIGT